MNVTTDLNTNHRLKSKIHRNQRSVAALDTSNPDYKPSPSRRKLPAAPPSPAVNKTFIHSVPKTLTKPRLFYPSSVKHKPIVRLVIVYFYFSILFFRLITEIARLNA